MSIPGITICFPSYTQYALVGHIVLCHRVSTHSPQYLRPLSLAYTACAAASRLMWLQHMPFVMLECVCCGLDKVCVCEKFRAVRNYPSSIIMNAKTGLLSTIVPSSTLLKRCRVVRVLVVNNSPVVSRDCGVRKAWLSRLLILRRRLTPTTGHSDTRQRRGDDEADHCSDHEGVRVQVKGVDA